MSWENLIFTVPLLAWSTWLYWRATTTAREDWISSGPRDPQVIAAMMNRLGWLERKRLTLALKQRSQA